MSASEPNAGWKEWTGGECPVPGWTRIEVEQRSGRISGPYDAENCIWQHWVPSRAGRDIIAYRIVEPTK